MEMVIPSIPQKLKQSSRREENKDVFFHRLSEALTYTKSDYAFSLDIILRGDEMYSDQAKLRRTFFDTYIKQMDIILPALKDYMVFVSGGVDNEITMAIVEADGEFLITNPRFSGQADDIEADFELLVGMIYTQAILAKHNENKWTSGQVITEEGDEIPFFGKTARPAPYL